VVVVRKGRSRVKPGAVFLCQNGRLAARAAIMGADTYGIMVRQPRRNVIMKIVTISMELVIDEDMDESFIPQYLNDKLYTDPEFFGDFGPENIAGVITVVE
jgi:hypothetical protein